MLVTVEKLVETQNILSKTKKKRKKTRPDEENEQEAKLNKSSGGAKERKNSETAANSSSSGSDEYFLEWRIDEKYIQNQNLYSCGSSSSVDDLERIGNANKTTTDAPSSSFLRSTAATPGKRVDYQKVPNVSLIRSSIISSPDNKKSSSLNERIMLEMEQTNKYNDLFFEKQRRNNNDSNNNESRTTSILDQFHQSYLDPSRNGRLQTINDDENEEKVGTKTTTTKRSISARPIGPALVEDVVDEWDEFARFLEHILDVYAYRDSSLFIDEFRRLEAYLMAEYEQNEETAERGDDAERATVYFMNQQQIADHLNDLIKIKQFQLSQSKALFESTKNSFFELLEVKLSPNNLNECQARFDKYCQNYFFIFDQIKSKLKLKMSKYENYIKIWNDFDSDCEDLDLTFEELKDKRINCNLKYRSKELEITNVLSRLKAGLCSLAPVCHENKYYELKQKIIQYEIALKNFRSQNEQLSNQRSKLTTSTPSAQKTVDIQIDRHVYKEDNSENRMMSFADLEEHRPPRERRHNSSSIYYEPLSMRQKVRPTTVTPIRIDREYEDDLDDEEEVSDEYVDTDYMVRSVSSRSAVKRPPFVVGFSDLSPANRSMRRRRFNGVQMSDKSTATINDCATQTDSFRDERELPLDIDSMGESNKQHERQQQHEPLTRYMDTTPVKSSSTSGADLDHHHNHLVETEGKKLLLEAYLRTNDNLALIKQQQQQGQQNQENKTSDHHHNDTTTATSTPNKTPSSSQQSSQMMTKKPSHHHHRHNSKHTDTITVTTSGIGTATNDEEEEADDDDGHNTTTSSNQSMYDEFLYKNGHKLTVVEENIEPSVGQSTSRRRKSSKKQQQQQGDQQIQQQQQQQPSNEPSSKKLLKLLPLKAPVSVGASSSSCSTLDLDSKRHPRREKFLPFLSQKQAAKAKLSTLDNNATNSAARKSDVDQVDTKQRASIFKRLLQYVLLFLIPLLFIILVYFIYIYFLNPSCCDFKRNYLFINVS